MTRFLSVASHGADVNSKQAALHVWECIACTTVCKATQQLYDMRSCVCVCVGLNKRLQGVLPPLHASLPPLQRVHAL